jgi:hypothetical protein
MLKSMEGEKFMKYTEPKCKKSEAQRPPVTANFAPPPVEQPMSSAAAEDADEENDVSEEPAGPTGQSKA